MTFLLLNSPWMPKGVYLQSDREIGELPDDVDLDKSQREEMKKVEAVRDVLTSGGRTVVQGALAWLWARSERLIPIPGFRTMEQLQDLLSAVEKGPLAPDEMKAIENILSSQD
jgi:aryl-alcohol dehydrogenase-like predicted oxidoreductase